MKATCIRTFEEGTALKNANNANATSVCYIVFGEKNTVEAFFVESAESVVLNPRGNRWEDAQHMYSLTKNGNTFWFQNSKGSIIYKGEQP